MQERNTQVVVDGHTITFRRMPADDCLDRLAELQSMMLGGIDPDLNIGDGEITQGQVTSAAVSAFLSMSKRLDRNRMKAVRDLLLDPEYTAIGESTDAKKLTHNQLIASEVDAGALLKIMVQAFIVHYVPVFTSAVSIFSSDQKLTAGGFLSALSALKSPA